MFLSVIKKIKARKFLEKYFSQQKILKVDEIDKISAVACIVNIDEFENIPALFSLAEALHLKDDQFSIIAHAKQPEKYKHIKCPLFSFKDFSWKLQAKENGMKTFLGKEYDLLINYFTKEKLPLLFLSTLTRAKMRAGFSRLDHDYNDIIFKIDMNDHALFKSELLKYLKILNKI